MSSLQLISQIFGSTVVAAGSGSSKKVPLAAFDVYIEPPDSASNEKGEKIYYVSIVFPTSEYFPKGAEKVRLNFKKIKEQCQKNETELINQNISTAQGLSCTVKPGTADWVSFSFLDKAGKLLAKTDSMK